MVWLGGPGGYGRVKTVLDMYAYCAAIRTRPRWPCSNTEVQVQGAGVRLDFVPQFVDRLKRGFVTNRTEVRSLEVSVTVVDHGCHGQ